MNFNMQSCLYVSAPVCFGRFATAAVYVILSWLPELNCKGTAGCWQSLNLLADSMFHRQAHFGECQTDVSLPLTGLLSPDPDAAALETIKEDNREKEKRERATAGTCLFIFFYERCLDLLSTQCRLLTSNIKSWLFKLFNVQPMAPSAEFSFIK